MKSAGLSNLVVIAGGILAWATYAWVGAGDLFVVLALMSVVIPAVVIWLLAAPALIRIGLGMVPSGLMVLALSVAPGSLSLAAWRHMTRSRMQRSGRLPPLSGEGPEQGEG